MKKCIIIYVLGIFTIIASCSKKEVSLDSFIIADINSQIGNTEYMRHYYLGMNLAIREINQAGGINGIPLRLIRKDSKGSAMIAYNVAKEAKEEGATVLTGGFDNTIAVATARYANDNKIIYLNTGTIEDDIINKRYANDWTFKLRSSLDLHIYALVDEFLTKENINSITIITYNNSFGREATDLFRSLILEKKPNVNFAKDIHIIKGHPIDDETILDIQNTPTRAVVFLVHPSDIRYLVKRLQENRTVFGKVVFIPFAGETEWLDSLGEKTPSNWITTGFPWYDINNQRNNDFIAKYKEINSLVPRNATYIGYNAIYMIYEALKRVKVYENDLNYHKRIRKALLKVKINTPSGFIEMRKDHKSSWGTYVGVLKPYTEEIEREGKTYKMLDVRIFDHKAININDIFKSQWRASRARKKSIKEDVPEEPFRMVTEKTQNITDNTYQKLDELLGD